ncbi:HAD family hydrolase [Methylomonas sp. HW2-6]|uniref:HAD family hydrolase n=1 Tax=Methylomonas sp. HW2-6 TaxID=3376687 RepID=UPI004042ECED
MLKSLYPSIDWQNVKAVGFDLDGTLYDEFDFIYQVYRPIAEKLSAVVGAEPADTYSDLLRCWLDKGSSYNRIFSDVLAAAGIEQGNAERTIGECLELFRAFRPVLQLNHRVVSLLEFMAEYYPLFLVSDGSCALQRAKFDALGLGSWFRPENIAISGCLTCRSEKPAAVAVDHIAIFNGACDPSEVVFFGDRTVDRLFAEAAGFKFVGVKCMWPV